jgi:hypothetical protein
MVDDGDGDDDDDNMLVNMDIIYVMQIAPMPFHNVFPFVDHSNNYS